MTKLTVDVERCKGCGYCVMSCPKKAIALSDSLNTKGYQFVAVDEALCIQCGTCYNVCPDLVYEIIEI